MNRLTLSTLLIVGVITVLLTGCGNSQPVVDFQGQDEDTAVIVAPVVDKESESESNSNSESIPNSDADIDTVDQPRVLPDAPGEFDPDAFDDEEIDELLEYIDALLNEAEEEVSAASTGTAN